MSTNNHTCEFCDEFRGGSENSFSRTYVDYLQDRTVLTTGRLKVVPTLGHFVKGYLLVVPKAHFWTLADMPAELMHELEEIKGALASRLSPLYGRYVFFEHGARGPGSGGCGISHAHLHAIPLSMDEVLPKLKSQFPHRPIASLSDLKPATAGLSYLYCEDSSSQGWLFFPRLLPSQYMRRLIAGAAGISQWNWRQSGREDGLLETRIETLRALSGV